MFSIFGSHSIRISNPTDYKKLLNEEIVIDPYGIIVVDWQAHPNILSQPKYLGDSVYPIINIEDGPLPYQNNVIRLYTENKWLHAVFFSGSNLTYGMPQNYRNIHLYYAQNATCTEADLERLMTWQSARSIDIREASGSAGVYLSQHANQFQHFDELNFIGFLAHPQNYKDVKVGVIVENVERLHQLGVLVDTLNEEQVAEFVRQPVPNGWFGEVRRDEHKKARVVAWMRKN